MQPLSFHTYWTIQPLSLVATLEISKWCSAKRGVDFGNFVKTENMKNELSKWLFQKNVSLQQEWSESNENLPLNLKLILHGL